MKTHQLFFCLLLAVFAAGCYPESKDENILITEVPWFHGVAALPDDIKFTKAQQALLEKHGTLFPEKPDYIGPNITDNPLTNYPIKEEGSNRSVGIYPSAYKLWAMVRFTYGSNLSVSQKKAIKEALRHWEAKTNVRFYNATGKPTTDPTYGFNYPYVEFVRHLSVNNSYVGRIGGRQVINIANFSKSVIVHEIGHAVGLFHEHNHPRRDDYINVNFKNIKKGRHNWEKVKTNYYALGGVDFNSVMLYDSYILHPDYVHNVGIPVMTKKDGSTFNRGVELSDMDRSWANTFYLPYIARSDTYRELDDTIYKPDGTIMSAAERLQLQMNLNYGNPYPPANGRIPNNL